MESDRLKKCLMTFHWSTLALGDILDCPTDVVMGWYFGYNRRQTGISLGGARFAAGE